MTAPVHDTAKTRSAQIGMKEQHTNIEGIDKRTITRYNVGMAELDELLTVREVAERSGYSEGHVRKLLAGGVIEGRRIGYTWLVPAGEVEKLVERRGARRTRPASE